MLEREKVYKRVLTQVVDSRYNLELPPGSCQYLKRSGSSYRGTEWLRLEGTSGGHICPDSPGAFLALCFPSSLTSNLLPFEWLQ